MPGQSDLDVQPHPWLPNIYTVPFLDGHLVYASNVSSPDLSGAVQVDADHPARDRKVVGSNPTSGSKTAGQGMCALLQLLALLASLIIPQLN
jgi:hypothetical protein